MDFLTIGLMLLTIMLVGVAMVLFRHLNRAKTTMLRAVEEKAGSLARQQSLEQQIGELRGANELAQRRTENALSAQRDAEKREALAVQKLQDFEALKEQMSRAAQEAVVKGGTELSNKLLADHKREAEASRKEAEERTQKVAEGLMQQVTQITQAVSVLGEQTRAAAIRTDSMYRALSTPGGAGQMAEIGLENALKNLGLENGRDFVMQYAIAATEESGRLRPDAVVFLPQGRVLVVDSKASKHLLDIAEAQDEASEIAALDSLKRSMNHHLKTLVSRDYKAAIEKAYAAGGRKGEITHVFNVMCLPNEGAIERLRRADPEFMSKVQREKILLISPMTLSALFSLACMEIGIDRQTENYERIIGGVEQLLGSIDILASHAAGVGKGIKSAADSYTRFTASFNRTLLQKIKALGTMGIRTPKERGLAKPLPDYRVTLAEELTLEDEAADEGSPILELLVNHPVEN